MAVFLKECGVVCKTDHETCLLRSPQNFHVGKKLKLEKTAISISRWPRRREIKLKWRIAEVRTTRSFHFGAGSEFYCAHAPILSLNSRIREHFIFSGRITNVKLHNMYTYIYLFSLNEDDIHVFL